MSGIKRDKYEDHINAAARALRSSTSRQRGSDGCWPTSQIAMANLAYARELRETGL